MSESSRSSSRRRLSLVFPCGLLVCFAASSLLAQPKPRVVSSQSSPERTHQLFVGIDVFVPQQNEMMQVKNIRGETSLLAGEDGQLTKIDRTTGFRFKLVPKVCNIAAEIENLEWRTVFSPANDPNRKWVGRQTNIMNYQQDRLQEIDNPTYVGSAAPIGYAASESRAAGLMKESNSIDQMTSAEFSKKEVDARAESTGGHDAMELEFRISAPEPIAHAYLIALTRVRDAKGTITDINFHREIGAIGPQPRKILHLQTGIAPGSEIIEVKTHLFSNGKELATNLSEKRFELTTEEAKQYLMLDHVANHRGQSIAAHPVWELAPAELKAMASASAVDFPVTVEIDADGQLTRLDPGALIVPESLLATIKRLTFLPALEEGAPVASTRTVNLADYFR